MRVPQELLYSPNELREFFEKEQPDYIFHLAAYGNMSHQKDIPMTVMANLIGTFNMLHESRNIPYKGFINFGSSSEYGKKNQAMAEKDIIEPETFYGASKGGATLLARSFARQFDKPIVTVRPFSVYGPGEADFRFIPTVCRSIILDSTFTLSNTDSTHDWIYIDDFISGVDVVRDNIVQLSGKIVNIGSGRMHTNKEVCEALKRIADKPYLATTLKVVNKFESETWMSDNTKISQLGFFPKYMLAEGLKKTFDYYKEKYGNE